jgi:hypothetical protein
LKGAPAPKWLEEGIPYIERDEEKEQFNAPAETPVAEAPVAETASGSETTPVAGAAAPQ